MTVYTRRTTKEDFLKKDEGYMLENDENTAEKFIKKYPYILKQRPRWQNQSPAINRLGKLEAIIHNRNIYSPKSLEEKLKRLDDLELLVMSLKNGLMSTERKDQEMYEATFLFFKEEYEFITEKIKEQ